MYTLVLFKKKYHEPQLVNQVDQVEAGPDSPSPDKTNDAAAID